jgi:flagellar hook-associated protein 3 FlgL
MLATDADRVLRSVNDLMAQASELTIAAASETASTADRTTYAIQLAGIADELDSLARTKTVSGDPLFSNGPALQMRFGKDVVFAPVKSAADTFAIGGRSVAQIVRDSSTSIATGASTAIPDIQNAASVMADRRADLGQRAARLDALDESLKQRTIALSESRSALEDTDLSSAITALNDKLTSLDAARAAFARINRQTLFDILR